MVQIITLYNNKNNWFQVSTILQVIKVKLKKFFWSLWNLKMRKTVNSLKQYNIVTQHFHFQDFSFSMVIFKYWWWLLLIQKKKVFFFNNRNCRFITLIFFPDYYIIFNGYKVAVKNVPNQFLNGKYRKYICHISITSDFKRYLDS